MTAPIFKDLGKRASDLFSKDFPSDKKEIRTEWKGQTLNGVTFETSLVKDKNGAILGTLTPKYKFKEYGAEISGEFNTKRDFKGELNVTDQFVDGLKTIFTFNKGAEIWSTLGYEYKHKLGTSTASIDYGKSKGSTLSASGVVGSQGFAFGVSGDYFLGGNSLQTLNGTVSYSSAEFDVTAFGRIKNQEEEKNEIGGSYFHKVSSDLAVGSEIVYDLSNPDAKPKLTFGTQFALNYDTTLKAKFDTNGILALSYQQKFNKNAKLTVSSSIDTNNLSGKSASTFGLALNLSD